MLLPPSSVGSVQLTWAWPPAVAAATPVGAFGAVAPVGVTALVWPDSGPEPLALVACTLNVYDVPGVRLRTLAVVAGGVPVTVVVACAVEPMYGVTA